MILAVQLATQPTQRALALPETISYGENWLSVSAAATDEDLSKACQVLRRVQSSLNWLIGDFLNGVAARDKVFQLSGSEYARQMAESFGVSYQTCRDAMFVSSCFDHITRIKSSTYTHHREAINETRDPNEAIKWVQKAADEGLSVSQMRAAIRLSRADPDRLLCSSIQTDYSPMYNFIRFIQKHKPKDISIDDSARIMDEVRKIRAWIDAVQDRAEYSEFYKD